MLLDAPSHWTNYHLPSMRSSGIHQTKISEEMLNSLAPGKFEWNFRYVIFKRILMIDGWGMAWCHQAASHYLSQRWPRYLLPYGITRPQWVNISITKMHFFFFWGGVFFLFFLGGGDGGVVHFICNIIVISPEFLPLSEWPCPFSWAV